MALPEFLTTSDVAMLTGLSVSRIGQLAKGGALPCSARTRRGIGLFTEEAVEKFIDRERRRPGRPTRPGEAA